MYSKSVNLASFVNYEDALRLDFAHKSNFCVEINGDIFSFVYARKFACSTLKRLVKELHGDVDFFDYKRKHLYRDCNHKLFARVFFYRDPLEHVVSCFFNKFIVKKGAVNAILSLEKSLCGKIDDFSFKQLCENYLPLIHQNPQAVNPHLYPLAFHLLPIEYTHAVKMSDLFNAMNELLGLDIASRCFKQPVNNSSTSGLIDAPSGTDWTEIPVGKLCEMKDQFTYGSFKRSLMINSSLNHLVNDVYSLDCDIARAIKD
jgi:hypothetical protein